MTLSMQFRLRARAAPFPVAKNCGKAEVIRQHSKVRKCTEEVPKCTDRIHKSVPTRTMKCRRAHLALKGICKRAGNLQDGER